MMNVVALGLVLSSLVTAGVFSPSPAGKDATTPICGRDDDLTTVMKEGHCALVVEFEKDGNTKVLVSPHEHLDHGQTHFSSAAAAAAKEKVSTAVEDADSSALPNTNGRDGIGGYTGPTKRDVVCDALGKCKHRIASAIDRAKTKVSETEHEVEEHTKEAVGKAKEKVSETAHEVEEAVTKAKDTVSPKTGDIVDKTREVEESAKHTVTEASTKAKDTLTDTAHRLETGAKVASHKFKETVEQSARDTAEKAKHGAETAYDAAKNEAEKDLKEILRRGRDVGYDMVRHAASRRAVEAAMAMAHLVGFSAAYGMCLWVTFVSSYVLVEALPRQQLAVVQSKLYLAYFRTMAYSVLLALIGHLMVQRGRLFCNLGEMLQGCYLLASFFMLMFNLLYLEPRATKTMFERMKMEKEEGRGTGDSISDIGGRAAEPVTDHDADHRSTTPVDPISTPNVLPETPEAAAVRSRFLELSERLKVLNAYSSSLNISTLMVLTWHLVYLGHHLSAVRHLT